jgi:hypothetical protein
MALNPADISVESFPTTDTAQMSSTPQVSEPPMICSCFGSCDMFCPDQLQPAAY